MKKSLWCRIGLHRWALSPDGKTEMCLECPAGGPVPGTEQDPVTLVENLPMLINLGGIGDWRSHIGWATVTNNPVTGCNTIEISLNEESSKELGNMVEAFDLKAIGFAGIQRRPNTQTES
jgi:hypothetical protein